VFPEIVELVMFSAPPTEIAPPLAVDVLFSRMTLYRPTDPVGAEMAPPLTVEDPSEIVIPWRSNDPVDVDVNSAEFP
jgi:hypothetical protein